jgi:CubicO group peptidase (beta-lactamase class C family)
MASSSGRLTLDTPVGLEDLDPVRKDYIVNTLNRGLNVTYRDLMGMSDVLQMSERYELGESVSDMLFNKGDSAAFASKAVGKPSSPAVSPSDTCRFGWFYSSGVSNILAKEFRKTFPSHEAYTQYMLDDFLGKIGSSFTFEPDASGTFVASSFVYATARDFARFGLFLLQEQQRPLLELLQQPHCDSGGLYSSTASVWLNPSRFSPAPTDANLTGRQDWRRFYWMTKTIPSDCFMLSGYFGQFLLVCPSLDLVVARFGYSFDGPVDNDEQDDLFSRPRLIHGVLTRLGLKSKY